METPALPANPLEFEAAHFVRRLVGEAREILIVGPGHGRDYFALGRPGRRIRCLDLFPQNLPPGALVLGDAGGRLPFRDASFDCVVACEVLEHLFDDAIALKDIRRMLRPDGRLVLSVPFLHDRDNVHVQVYTPPILQRLLDYVGFRTDVYVERGGRISGVRRILAWRRFRRALARLGVPFDPEIPNLRMAERDWDAGLGGNPRFRRSPYYGCFLRAFPAEPQDPFQVQRARFTRVSPGPV